MNKAIDNYEVVHENDINKFLKRGFQPYGDLIFNGTDFWQAMVTYRDVEFFDKGYVKAMMEEITHLREEKRAWLEKHKEGPLPTSHGGLLF